MRNKTKRRIFKAMLVVFFIFSAFLMLLSFAGNSIRSNTLALLIPAAENELTMTVNEIILEILDEEKLDYDSMVNITKDENGKINSISVNMFQVNMLKSRISASLAGIEKNRERMEVGIPIGNLFGSELLSGRGMEITIRIIPSGALRSDIESEFSAEGINQTLHRLTLKIELDCVLALPLKSEKVSVNTTLCIAETVIIGEVPDTYAHMGIFSGDLSGEKAISDLNIK